MNFKLRDDVKPLHVVQPEGVSFKVNGNELEWQNWKMHVGKIPMHSHPVSPHSNCSIQSSGGHSSFYDHLQ